MNASTWHRTPILLAAALGAAVTAVTACGSSAAPPVGAPPASRHTAVERAATLNWLTMTNQMWTPSSPPTRRPTRRVRPAAGSCWTASSAGR